MGRTPLDPEASSALFFLCQSAELEGGEEEEEEEETEIKMREEEMEKLRGVVKDCLAKHLYSSAIFFADKLAAFSSDPTDIFLQAQALFLGGHYRRAFHLLNTSPIIQEDRRFLYLAAKCLVISSRSPSFSTSYFRF